MNYSKIMEYCQKNDISISTFEKMCGIGNGTVARWNPELEKPSMPSLDSLQKITRCTGIPMAELLTGVES
ncbi:MAG: helix-turn-helix transcriptional regulator [Lachnospiraceae bacterium]|nr:helix-turn-helix transcriptional regulator [Lachnospiraceae bacterium]